MFAPTISMTTTEEINSTLILRDVQNVLTRLLLWKVCLWWYCSVYWFAFGNHSIRVAAEAVHNFAKYQTGATAISPSLKQDPKGKHTKSQVRTLKRTVFEIESPQPVYENKNLKIFNIRSRFEMILQVYFLFNLGYFTKLFCDVFIIVCMQ